MLGAMAGELSTEGPEGPLDSWASLLGHLLYSLLLSQRQVESLISRRVSANSYTCLPCLPALSEATALCNCILISRSDKHMFMFPFTSF